MIQQSAIGINSRSEVNPFDKNGMLPLITAPMNCVVNSKNAQFYIDNKIYVCNTRSGEWSIRSNYPSGTHYYSLSLKDFERIYLEKKNTEIEGVQYICIDVANGNIPRLHAAVVAARIMYGDDMNIMAGNVGSVDAFLELAHSGVNSVRVGIGGGGGCNTTKNTGVGQSRLDLLVYACYIQKKSLGLDVEIIADGFTSHLHYCEGAYGFNDNGYAAINKLLWMGADKVMLGRIFAQCAESAGEKRPKATAWEVNGLTGKEIPIEWEGEEVLYAGMSTIREQSSYKPYNLKPSEGTTTWLPVLQTLPQWLNGIENQDEYPYLIGMENALRSAMTYTGSKTIEEFKIKEG